MAGVNTVIIESTDQHAAMLSNLAFTLSLDSGQMGATTQNLLVSRDGIATDEGHKSFERVSEDLAAAVTQWVSDPRVATLVLCAVGSAATLARMQQATTQGRTGLASRALPHPEFANAQIHTPAIVALTQADSATYGTECFGPVSYLVATDYGAASLQVEETTLRAHGALTLGVYSSNRCLHRPGRGVGPTHPRGTVHQPHAERVREPVRRVLGLTRHGRQPGSERQLHQPVAFVADRVVVVQRREHVTAAPAQTV